MSNIDLERERGRTGDRNRGEDRRSVKMVTTTETRRAFMTTEFWIAIAMAAAVVIAGYINDSAQLDLTEAWALGCGVVAFYVLSRGIAKAGSYDPEVKDIDY
jgi:hypothetical protein